MRASARVAMLLSALSYVTADLLKQAANEATFRRTSGTFGRKAYGEVMQQLTSLGYDAQAETDDKASPRPPLFTVACSCRVCGLRVDSAKDVTESEGRVLAARFGFGSVQLHADYELSPHTCFGVLVFEGLVPQGPLAIG